MKHCNRAACNYVHFTQFMHLFSKRNIYIYVYIYCISVVGINISATNTMDKKQKINYKNHVLNSKQQQKKRKRKLNNKITKEKEKGNMSYTLRIFFQTISKSHRSAFFFYNFFFEYLIQKRIHIQPASYI